MRWNVVIIGLVVGLSIACGGSSPPDFEAVPRVEGDYVVFDVHGTRDDMSVTSKYLGQFANLEGKDGYCSGKDCMISYPLGQFRDDTPRPLQFEFTGNTLRGDVPAVTKKIDFVWTTPKSMAFFGYELSCKGLGDCRGGLSVWDGKASVQITGPGTVHVAALGGDATDAGNALVTVPFGDVLGQMAVADVFGQDPRKTAWRVPVEASVDGTSASGVFEYSANDCKDAVIAWFTKDPAGPHTLVDESRVGKGAVLFAPTPDMLGSTDIPTWPLIGDAQVWGDVTRIGTWSNRWDEVDCGKYVSVNAEGKVDGDARISARIQVVTVTLYDRAKGTQVATHEFKAKEPYCAAEVGGNIGLPVDYADVDTWIRSKI